MQKATHFTREGGASQKSVSGIPASEAVIEEVYDGAGFGNIITETGAYVDKTVDYTEDTQPSEVIVSDDDLSDIWNAIKQAMDDIESEVYQYKPITQNSNNVVLV